MSFCLESGGFDFSLESSKKQFYSSEMPVFADMMPNTHSLQDFSNNLSTYSTTPKLSLTLTSGMESKLGKRNNGEMNESYESRSGCDNNSASAEEDDEQDNNNHQPSRKKKRYHRHTPQQIQEMEALFKEYPHPDEKQRTMLSKQLGLAPRQIKFWFQNRRTQMKAHHERHENAILRQENDKLRLENMALREAMRNPMCASCGGHASSMVDMNFGDHHLQLENARLKEEVQRASALASKYYGVNRASIPPLIASDHNPSLELAVGHGEDGVYNTSMNPAAGFLQGFSVVPSTGQNVGEGIDSSTVLKLAMSGMDELVKLAQINESLWFLHGEDGNERLNCEEYSRLFPSVIKDVNHRTEATRRTENVLMSGVDLVETMINPNRFAEMFLGVVSKAASLDVLMEGIGGNRHNVLQLMYMEMQVLSPLVPSRKVQFLRFSQQHGQGLWAVVDISLDCLGGSFDQSISKFKRRTSGCIIQDLSNGFSKVTWIEHTEYDDRGLQGLCKTIVTTGMSFGALRWLSTLQRQRECRAVLLGTNFSSREENEISPAGRSSMIKLAQRMTSDFLDALSFTSAKSNTTDNNLNTGDNEIVVAPRKVNNQPGGVQGIVFTASTSVWLPLIPERLFLFLKQERLRNRWDILSSCAPMQELTSISKGKEAGNCISVLSGNGVNGSGNGSRFILQECSTDPSASLVVYAPVNQSELSSVMEGADPSNVDLLSSGFAIFPVNGNSDVSVNGNSNCSLGGGSILTISFQMVRTDPSNHAGTAKHLISSTLQKIKSALQCEDS